ncbi:hypothetical protein U8607_03735 [Methylobacterium durans]|uniref:hypothetical protein n=1 Tax=Methylobacterium durans TaxID=2202825 RepID=UPI002B000690|nr:hypothetical protein [Methylobacterium durans]MEA1831186.1 hypothetical protein [Methylobacterium durans]
MTRRHRADRDVPRGSLRALAALALALSGPALAQTPADPAPADQAQTDQEPPAKAPAKKKAPPVKKPAPKSSAPKPPVAKPPVAKVPSADAPPVDPQPVASPPVGAAREPDPARAPAPVPAPAPTPVATPAAGPAPGPCGAQAARYEGQKGFALFVTRKGRAEVENPLLPLTPEVTQVLQVVIGAKLATAYGPDLAALRRGSAPAVLEAQLGGPIRWESSLPALPDPITIVSEAGETLASLSFRGCAEAPAVKAAPEAKVKEPAKGQPPRRAAAKPEGEGGAAGAVNEGPAPAPKARPREKAAGKPAPQTPPGFGLPQGAIAE